jgi:MFS family permease
VEEMPGQTVISDDAENTNPETSEKIMPKNTPLRRILVYINSSITSDNLITVGSFGLITYIIGLILSKTTACVIIWRWFDLIVVTIPGLIFIVLLYFMNNEQDKSVVFTNNVMFNILFVLSIVITITLSIISNIKNNHGILIIIFAIVSILSKVFIMILVPVFILLFLGAINYGKDDRRYKGGKRGNANLIAMAIIGGLAVLLVGSLVKKTHSEGE